MKQNDIEKRVSVLELLVGELSIRLDDIRHAVLNLVLDVQFLMRVLRAGIDDESLRKDLEERIIRLDETLEAWYDILAEREVERNE